MKRIAKRSANFSWIEAGICTKRLVLTLNLGGKAWHCTLQFEASLTEVLKVSCARFVQFLSFPSKQQGVFDKGREKRLLVTRTVYAFGMDAGEGKEITWQQNRNLTKV